MTLRDCWFDLPSEPGRLPVDDPDVRRLAEAVAPGSRVTDLGGTMSLNLRLEPADLVLRVHQPFVTRRRMDAVQEVRRRLGAGGLLVPAPLAVLRCRNRWAEVEPYIPNERRTPTPEAHTWLFRAMGALHRSLSAVHVEVPRPLVATFGPPGSLQRWLPVTAAAVRGDRELSEIVGWVRALVDRLRARWVPAERLPVHLIHGDARLSNVRRTPDGRTAYLDFGFCARRPRIHDLAYTLAFELAWDREPERVPWRSLPGLIEAYHQAGAVPLTDLERTALAPYMAAVALYHAALAGYTNDPGAQLRARRPFLRLAEWLLTHGAELPV